MILSYFRRLTLQYTPKHTFYIAKFCSNKDSPQQIAYYKHRLQTITKMQYPSFKPTMNIKQYREKYSHLYQQHLQKKVTSVQSIEKIAGRILNVRTHGKTTFIDILEEHIRLQIVHSHNKQQQFQYRRGDIIGIIGKPYITKKGQLSILAEQMQLLSPCLWMLPQYNSLKDPESRYRKKHLDLITNEQSFNKLKLRAKIMKQFRNYLQQKGFVQVETPILSTSCGGAIAKPFQTFHNDYKMDMFLRIAPQLYLKRLLIGGMNRVYEIGKNFRNESVDQTHNPQFTSCELYCAYSDYKQMMDFTKDLIITLAIKINGNPFIVKPGSQQIIDLTKQWKVVDFIPTLQQQLKVVFPFDLNSQEAHQILEDLCKQHHVECSQPRTSSRLLDKLGQRFLQGKGDPLFIINHPKILSPLAKPIPDKPHLTQRFELFINGWEVVNSYTQLNIAKIQQQNTPNERQFIQALEYGLMPCAGWGIGLDRLIMLLTNSSRIQQVISYPLLRHKQQQ